MTDLKRQLNDFTSAMESGVFTLADRAQIDLEAGIESISEVLKKNRADRGSVFLIGNGGSAAIASHIANDFVNTGRLDARVMHDQALLTCFANDYGYDQIYAMQLERVVCEEDVLVAVSSSGNSSNIVNAAIACANAGGTVFTFTGFEENNALRQMGDLNYWIDSTDYGLVEIGHLFLLHYVASIISKS